MKHEFAGPTTDADVTTQWIRIGGVCGVLAMLDYILLIAVDMPESLGATVASAFGPLLSVASYGLYLVLSIPRRSAALQIALVSNVVAGALITAMLLVQTAVRSGGRGAIDPFLWTKLRRVDLGLDVAWDVYGVIAAFLFAWSMLRHPRFGRLIGAIGVLLATGLAVLNLSTFPTPPDAAGLFDLGPFMGLWYVVVFVQTLRCGGWSREAMAQRPATAFADLRNISSDEALEKTASASVIRLG